MVSVPPDYSIDIVEKALKVLKLFDYQAPSLSLVQIAKRLDISKTRAFRIAQTMLECQFLTWDTEDRVYRLGTACLHLGLVARTGDIFKNHLVQILYALHRDSEETVNLAFMQERHLYYAMILESPQALRVSEVPGDLVPWLGTALGRAFLAAVVTPSDYVNASLFDQIQSHLVRTQERGYAIDDQESVSGVRCVGVALRGRANDAPIGAISISGPLSRMTDARLRHWGERLKATVAELYSGLKGVQNL